MEEKKSKSKRALAIIAGPYRIMQMVWIALKYSDYQWDIALIPYGADLDNLKKIQMQCENAGIFNKVYIINSVITRFSNVFSKIWDTVKMISYFIAGKKKNYCKTLLEKEIGEFDYDMLCVACSYSLIEGAALNFSDEIPTIIIQEGLADYTPGKIKYDFMTKIGGYILYKMQYMNCLCYVDFPPLKNCIKYASNPELLYYKNYKRIERLYDDLDINEKSNQILKKMYKVEANPIYDVVIFTSVMGSLTLNEGRMRERFRKWLDKNYHNKKILIKKHPQDTYKYDWDELDIECKYEIVPGEIIIQLMKNAKFIFEFPSSILLQVIYDSDYDYQIVHYNREMAKEYEQKCRSAFEFLKIKDKQLEI